MECQLLGLTLGSNTSTLSSENPQIPQIAKSLISSLQLSHLNMGI